MESIVAIDIETTGLYAGPHAITLIGLFNGQEEVDLPEKATVSMGVLGELRAMCRSRLDQSLATASRGGRKQDISLGAICGAGGGTMPGSPRVHYELFDARYLDRGSPKRSKVMRFDPRMRDC